MLSFLVGGLLLFMVLMGLVEGLMNVDKYHSCLQL